MNHVNILTGQIGCPNMEIEMPQKALLKTLTDNADRQLLDLGVSVEDLQPLSQICRRLLASSLAAEIMELGCLPPRHRERAETEVRRIVAITIVHATPISPVATVISSNRFANVLSLAECKSTHAESAIQGIISTLERSKS